MNCSCHVGFSFFTRNWSKKTWGGGEGVFEFLIVMFGKNFSVTVIDCYK